MKASTVIIFTLFSFYGICQPSPQGSWSICASQTVIAGYGTWFDAPSADYIEYLYHYSDYAQVQIHGDTMKVIRQLLREIHRLDSIEQQYYEFMAASVEFSNCVSAYFKDPKNNCAWTKYHEFIHKNGYMDVKRTYNERSCGCIEVVNPKPKPFSYYKNGYMPSSE